MSVSSGEGEAPRGRQIRGSRADMANQPTSGLPNRPDGLPTRTRYLGTQWWLSPDPRALAVVPFQLRQVACPGPRYAMAR